MEELDIFKKIEIKALPKIGRYSHDTDAGLNNKCNDLSQFNILMDSTQASKKLGLSITSNHTFKQI